jgi:ATP-dependent Lon protease
MAKTTAKKPLSSQPEDDGLTQTSPKTSKVKGTRTAAAKGTAPANPPNKNLAKEVATKTTRSASTQQKRQEDVKVAKTPLKTQMVPAAPEDDSPGNTLVVPMNLPLLPLRDVVIFPRVVMPLFVGRPKSIKALEWALQTERQVLLIAQKNAVKEEPEVADLFTTGCIVQIVQMIKLPDNTVKVLVEGKERAKLLAGAESQQNGFVAVKVEALPEPVPTESEQSEIEGLRRAIVVQFEQYVKLHRKVPAEILENITNIEDAVHLTDLIAVHLPLKLAEKQNILSLFPVQKRMETLLSLLSREVDILGLDKKIRSRVKRQVEKNQRDYYLNEQAKAIQKELGDGEDGVYIEELEKKIKAAKMPKEALKKAQTELKRLKLMSSHSADANVTRTYLETLVELPWSQRTKIANDLSQAEVVLNQDHFGLDKVKDRILEYLAVQQRVSTLKAPILCFVGPPGVGKTSLGQSIAKATGRKYVRMALGGVHDEAEIRGHRRTYIGALPGKILQGLSKVKTRNPLFLLDEVDKLGADVRGDPASALLEVLDPEQNHNFNDHYVELDFDLSEVMFVATANSTKMHPALLDRMELIKLSGYTEEEKIHIAKNHLLPKQMEKNGVQANELVIEEGALRDIVRHYTREAGVRSLEREIAKICRKVVKEITLGKHKAKLKIKAENLEKFLGIHKHQFGLAEKDNRIGQVVGLAWTEVGGDLLTIEVATLPGKANIIRTGSLGDVMKESVEAARSVVRSHAQQWGIPDAVFEKTDIHIHVPDGATPKDGPSAGVAMVLALVSSLTRIPVKASVAMTGEITLRGEVTSIGGLKEKLLAAVRGGIQTVLIPEKNTKDLAEVPQTVKDRLEIVPVKWIDQVLALALEHMPAPLPILKEELTSSDGVNMSALTALPPLTKNDGLNPLHNKSLVKH